jgi:hypothetical protein
MVNEGEWLHTSKMLVHRPLKQAWVEQQFRASQLPDFHFSSTVDKTSMTAVVF